MTSDTSHVQMALNVVDRSKMWFHYVAKLPRAPDSGQSGPAGGGGREAEREMKVCFRNSKHSIKCDVSAPCLECDQGLKLYSWEQSRRHCDVVRAERRFESSEVDRAEELLERLTRIDDNGKQVVKLLEQLVAKHEPTASTSTHPQHAHEEERVWRESTCCALKEIGKHSLRTHKQLEEMSAGVAREGQTLNQHLTHVRDQLDRQTSLLERHQEMRSESSQQTLAMLTDLNAQIRSLEAALSQHVADLKQEVTRLRAHLEDKSAHVMAEIARELHALNETTGDVRDGLPERLMDAFGGLLMLSAEHKSEVGAGVSLE